MRSQVDSGTLGPEPEENARMAIRTIEGVSGHSAASPASAVTGQPTLARGARGPAVAQLQRDLARAGFDPGGLDCVFGPKTASALRSFQAAHGLSVDGICGPKSWGALSGSSFSAPPRASAGAPALQEGATGANVSRLQSLLSSAGFNPGGIDGDFGPRTRAAVMNYQESRGLGVDGVVGPQTWSALNGHAPAVSRGPVPGATSSGSSAVRTAQSVLGQDISDLKYSGPLAPYLDKWPGNDVCCANFVSACLEKTGQISPAQHTDNVGALADSLRTDPQWSSVPGLAQARPGDVVCFDVPGEGPYQHVELFEGWQNGEPMFIGSNNVNPDGSQRISQGPVDYPVDAVFQFNG
jgi:peptidoglycan hydrolase-like protein with peptidoglycan-binding domain